MVRVSLLRLIQRNLALRDYIVASNRLVRCGRAFREFFESGQAEICEKERGVFDQYLIRFQVMVTTDGGGKAFIPWFFR